jgi:hypothetical protein
MFELLTWRFECWLVALILVLFGEDRNEINNTDMFEYSLLERQ